MGYSDRVRFGSIQFGSISVMCSVRIFRFGLVLFGSVPIRVCVILFYNIDIILVKLMSVQFGVIRVYSRSGLIRITSFRVRV